MRVSGLSAPFYSAYILCVQLSGYNRNATIDRNEFVWLGESAVASWGYNNGVDGTLGDQPWYTKVTNNLCHEIGHFEKQVRQRGAQYSTYIIVIVMINESICYIYCCHPY